MSLNITDGTKYRARIFFIMYNKLREMDLPEHINQKISQLLREESERGDEPFSQMILTITDILNTQTDVEEIEAELDKL